MKFLRDKNLIPYYIGFIVAVIYTIVAKVINNMDFWIWFVTTLLIMTPGFILSIKRVSAEKINNEKIT